MDEVTLTWDSSPDLSTPNYLVEIKPVGSEHHREYTVREPTIVVDMMMPSTQYDFKLFVLLTCDSGVKPVLIGSTSYTTPNEPGKSSFIDKHSSIETIQPKTIKDKKTCVTQVCTNKDALFLLIELDNQFHCPDLCTSMGLHCWRPGSRDN